MQRGKKVIIGNWKMGPQTLEEAKRIFSRIKRAASQARRTQVVICPPDLYLVSLARLSARSPAVLGVQDVFWEDKGRFTGQVSPAMARAAGARFAIIGHSEKRALGETAEETVAKLAAVVHDGMYGVLCIGETTRDKDGAFFSFLKNQLLSSLSRISRKAFIHSVLIAYEPIWTIGRGGFVAMSPREVHETSIFIRKVINDAWGAHAARAVMILYGGSVSPANACEIVYQGEVDGLLVGRESLDSVAFSEILTQVDAGR